MPRAPKPRYRADRDHWFAVIGGRRLVLAKGRDNRAEAERAFYRLMGQQADGSVPRSGLTVGDLIVRFLRDCATRREAGSLRPQTAEFYARFCVPFASAFGTEPAGSVRPPAVAAWASRPTWGPTTRANALTAVGRAFHWAVEAGLIEANPLGRLRKPARRVRQEILTPGQAEACIAAYEESDPFRALLEAAHGTGARPSELMEVEAVHLDRKHALVRMPSKTTGATGRRREIHLTAAMVTLFGRLASEHPEGPLFRNEDGRPWTRQAMSHRFRRLRKRLGLGPEATAESLRHLFVTDALDRGLPSSTVAALAGHKSTAMIDRVYSKLHDRHRHLKDALAQVRASGPEPGAGVPPASPGTPPPAPGPEAACGTRRRTPGGRRR